MFMSTRYKKKDPEWRKRPLFSVEDSLAKLLECLSIEYSVSKLISPKYKNFRSQKIKFESKTRINNAIWRAWHIQYKINRRPRFCQFAPPFSDLTVHSTPQAVILDGKTWKRRLDIVSREYKKWRKFYNVKILKGENREEKDNLKQLSNENSDDEFLSDEEEDVERKKLRSSPKRNVEHKIGAQSQNFFQSSEFMLDTFVADLPDTLFSSIPPAKSMKSSSGNALGLAFTDLSDMIQPTLDQLNPCFDELMENFDFLTADFSNFQTMRTLETVDESPPQRALPEIMNIESNTSGIHSGILDDRMYTDPLDSVSTYLYSSQFLLTQNPSMMYPKQNSSHNDMKPALASQDQRTVVDRSKREILPADISMSSSPPRKVIVKESTSENPYQRKSFLIGQPDETSTETMALARSTVTEKGSSKPTFEAMLSDAMNAPSFDQDSSSLLTSFNRPTKPDSSVVATSSSSLSDMIRESNLDIKSTNENSIQQVGQKIPLTSIVNQRTIEYSELPPQLQAPSLTAHLQAVMSTRTKAPANRSAIPRNKSDTQLVSLARTEKGISDQRNPNMRRDSFPLTPSKIRRTNRIPKNMSDTNLVQMAKDSCKVLARRRLTSISVDTRPLILPKNFSDSNLCALSLGVPKRPKPILPKSFVPIKPSSQLKATDSISKASLMTGTTSSNIISQTTVSGGGQFTTFLVNKQQPCSAGPVQVTLYMPKPKQSTASSSNSDVKTETSLNGNSVISLPQRVEVIQYQGSTQSASTKDGRNLIADENRASSKAPMLAGIHAYPVITAAKTMGLQNPTSEMLQTTAVTRGSSSGIVNSELYYSGLAKRSSEFSPAQATTKFQTALTNSLDFNPTNAYSEMSSASVNIAEKSVVSAIAVSETIKDKQANTMESSSIVASNTPIASSQNSTLERVAPLQGLSEQQLVSLAQILQGSNNQNIGQENTIAYLEMLQQQLNVLLQQQQAMLKLQQDTTNQNQQHQDQQKGNQQQQTIQHQQQLIGQGAQKQQQQIMQVHKQQSHDNHQVTQQAQRQVDHHQQQQGPVFERLNLQQLLDKQIQPKDNLVDLSNQQLHKNVLTGHDIRFIGSTSHELPKDNSVLHAALGGQYVQSPVSQRLSTNETVLIADRISQNAQILPTGLSQSLALQAKQNTADLHMIPFEARSTNTSSGTSQQQCIVAQYPGQQAASSANAERWLLNSSISSQPVDIPMREATQPQQTIASIASQQYFQPLQKPAVLTTGINSINQNNISSNLHSLLQNQSGTGNVQGMNIEIVQGSSSSLSSTRSSSSGDGTVRPTMVDLAIAASQRSYLVDRSPSYSDSSMESGYNDTQNKASATSVNTRSLPIPTVVISDSTPTKTSDSSSLKRQRQKFQDRDTYKEYRRRSHVSAEQKRRSLIKVAFDQMISLIPTLKDDKQGRTSKALVLQKGAEYIEHLQRERTLAKEKVEKLRGDVNRLNEEIRLCQQKLPASGAISEKQNITSFQSSFLQHVREQIVKDHKYWIFSVMVKPLFESFKENVATDTLQQFIQTVLKWFDDYCSLPVLRPAVTATLRQFSTGTAILSDPSLLPAQSLEAAAKSDPTMLGQQQGAMTSSSSSRLPTLNTTRPLSYFGSELTDSHTIAYSEPSGVWILQSQTDSNHGN